MPLMETIGFTSDVIGKIMTAISVIAVHTHVMKERKVDSNIVKEMKRERNLSILGIVLIIAVYLLQLPYKI